MEKREKIATLFSFPLAYWYIQVWEYLLDEPFAEVSWRIGLAIFTLGFVLLAEYLLQKESRPTESWIWLSCMAVILIGILCDSCQVWGAEWAFFALHIFAVYWVISRADRLAEGESGHLLLVDVWNGYLYFPFKHFLLRLRLLYHMLKKLPRKKVIKREVLGYSLFALLMALLLFVAAVSLLFRADSGFAALIERLIPSFDWEISPWPWIKLILSLPVGAYFLGLIAGCHREDPQELRAESQKINQGLLAFRRVPNRVWIMLTACFCALYLLFFLVQARYLFGAFTGKIPEGFILSEYARQGFFELCRVMAVDFALLWLVTRSSAQDIAENRKSLTICLLLLAESMLFAVVAFSKLLLYIRQFGFTPLRLQSSWLVWLLFFGCACWMYSLLTKKKSFRAWMIFGAFTFSALSLY